MAMQNNAKYLQVDKALTADDLKSMIFLCREIVGESQRRKLSDSRGILLIQELQKRFPEREKYGIIYQWNDLLEELLYHVGQKALLRSLGTSKEDISARLKMISLVNPFTLLLFEIRQEMVPKELSDLKFMFCQKLWAKDEKINDALELFIEMEKRGMIGPSGKLLDALIEMIDFIKRRDILKKIEIYKEKNPDLSARQEPQSASYVSMEESSGHGILFPPAHPARLPGMSGDWATSPPNQYTSLGPQGLHEGDSSPGPQSFHHAGYSGPVSGQGAQSRPQADHSRIADQQQTQQQQQQHGASRHTAVTRQESQGNSMDQEMECYKMDASPRGYCLIINNENFSSNSTAPGLPKREGSNIDKDKLKSLFESLHFIVMDRTDISAAEMEKEINDLAKREHGNLDCLLVFVLTHGDIGRVYGSDCQSMKITDLTQPFRADRCPSLANKPKMFFIQACQGKQTQPKVDHSSLQADAPDNTSTIGTQTAKEQIEGALPGPDFLLSYATIPGYVSYRSMSKGAWFINALVAAIKKYHAKQDLLSILTKVNQKVGEAHAKYNNGVYHQNPAPHYTLRYRLYFDSTDRKTHC